MTEREYRQHPAISRSELCRIADSPEKFKYYQEHPQPLTPALLFGQVFHKLALETESFLKEFAVMPDVDRRTKDGEAFWGNFLETSREKTIIDKETYEKASAMVQSLQNAPYVSKLLSGAHEKAFFWADELTNEECKCRVDCLTDLNGQTVIVDLKSTTDASTDEFMRSAVKYGYDFQAGMYSDGVEKCTGKKPLFVFIAVEKEPPYAVNIFQADELFVKRGRDIFRELIQIYHDCKTSGNWWGYLGPNQNINQLALPAWLAREME